MPDRFMSYHTVSRDSLPVALPKSRRYPSAVAANSAIRVWRPGNEIGAQAPHTIEGAFFVPATTSYGGCAWETFGSAGFQFPRFANLRTAATLSFGDDCWQLQIEIGVPTMHALKPSKNRAAAHRAMALAALHANSSLITRLTRYNLHMTKARALESVEDGK